MKSLISSVKQTFTYYVAQSYNGVSQLRTSIKTAVTSVQSVTDIYEYAPYIKYVDFSQQNVNIQQWSKLTEPRTLIKQLNREKKRLIKQAAYSPYLFDLYLEKLKEMFSSRPDFDFSAAIKTIDSCYEQNASYLAKNKEKALSFLLQDLFYHMLMSGINPDVNFSVEVSDILFYYRTFLSDEQYKQINSILSSQFEVFKKLNRLQQEKGQEGQPLFYTLKNEFFACLYHFAAELQAVKGIDKTEAKPAPQKPVISLGASIAILADITKNIAQTMRDNPGFLMTGTLLSLSSAASAMTTFENRFSSTISDAQGNSYIVNSVVNTNEGSFGVGYMAWNYPYVCNKTFGLVMNFDNEQITFAYKYEASVPYLLFQKVINLPNGNLKVRGSLTHSYDSFALASPYSEPVLQKAVPFTVEMTPQGKIVDAFSLNITDFMGQDIVATPDGGSITIDLYRTSLANGFVPFRTLITMFDNSTVLQQSIRKNQIGSITAGINDQNNLLLNGNVGLGNNAGTEEVSIATGESLSLQYPVCSGDANFNVLAMNVTSNMQQFVGSYQQSQLALIQYDTNHQLKNIFTYTHPSAPIAFFGSAIQPVKDGNIIGGGIIYSGMNLMEAVAIKTGHDGNVIKAYSFALINAQSWAASSITYSIQPAPDGKNYDFIGTVNGVQAFYMRLDDEAAIASCSSVPTELTGIKRHVQDNCILESHSTNQDVIKLVKQPLSLTQTDITADLMQTFQPLKVTDSCEKAYKWEASLANLAGIGIFNIILGIYQYKKHRQQNQNSIATITGNTTSHGGILQVLKSVSASMVGPFVNIQVDAQQKAALSVLANNLLYMVLARIPYILMYANSQQTLNGHIAANDPISDLLAEVRNELYAAMYDSTDNNLTTAVLDGLVLAASNMVLALVLGTGAYGGRKLVSYCSEKLPRRNYVLINDPSTSNQDVTGCLGKFLNWCRGEPSTKTFANSNPDATDPLSLT